MRNFKLLLTLLLMLSLMPLLAGSKLPYFGMNLVLPGSGELALGKTNKGVALVASDIIAISAYMKTAHDMDLQKGAYKSYAQHYAGVDPTMPLNHYQVVQDYYSSDEFNDFQDMMARNYFVIYHNDVQAYLEYMAANTYTGNESWEWQSQMHWENYQDMRRKHQKTKINHTLALGIMLLNRAIALVDIAITKTDGTVSLRPSGNDGVMLGYELNF